MSITLVVLAAGMGSRYGGLKQVDPVGPAGETVLDYAVFDAIRAGFDRVVFVIRRDFDALFREKIGARYAGRITVDYVYQSIEMLPPGFDYRILAEVESPGMMGPGGGGGGPMGPRGGTMTGPGGGPGAPGLRRGGPGAMADGAKLQLIRISWPR